MESEAATTQLFQGQSRKAKHAQGPLPKSGGKRRKVQPPQPEQVLENSELLDGTVLCFSCPDKKVVAQDRLRNSCENDGLAIAAFDLDSTLVQVKSGETFSKNAADWSWMFRNVKQVVQNLNLEK